MKLLSPSVSDPLSHLVNLCFSSGVFPHELKVATVTPIFKSGNKENPGNYRPISVISPISKIIERCMYQQISDFLKNFNVLSQAQYGFRTGHSTEHALLSFVDYAVGELDQGKYVLGIYLDIKKAFDSVNYSILFRKLQRYGIRGTPLHLIKSYLSNRRQSVKITNNKGNKTFSEDGKLSCGVPQGSVLGPLLFLIYVNDLKNVSDAFQAITFADDTNVFLSNNQLDVLCNTANSELMKVSDWLISNRLCLNISKTCYQLYTKKASEQVPILHIDGVPIKNEKIVRFLGVLVDEDLSFKQHINFVSQKVSVAIGFMFRGKTMLEKPQLKSIYNALVLPHLSYCSSIWAINFPTHLNRLFLLQKRAARIILGLQYRDPVSRRFTEIGMKTLNDIRDMRCLLLTYKIKHLMAPVQTRNLIEWKVTDQNAPQLRHNNPIIVPFARTVYKEHTFRVHNAKLFNSIHAIFPIDFAVSISVFKKTLYEHLSSFSWN